MKKSPLKDLVIRTALVRRPDLGFIYACDLNIEEDDIPHAIIFKWKAGEFIKGECNYDAHSLCVIDHPEPGLVDISRQGSYSANTRNGMISGNILKNCQPSGKERKFGEFSSVSEIEGKAYAVGLGGIVYRLDGLKEWTRIDEGLPDTFYIEAIHGFNASDLYAVGDGGQLWHFNEKKWNKIELPTNINLNIVKCLVDEKVYIAGQKGILIRGRGNKWDVIDHGDTKDNIWDLECFNGQLYVSTMHAVYRLIDDRLEAVDFGDDPPKTCYQLSAAENVMWSNGEHDIMSFDGTKWTRIV